MEDRVISTELEPSESGDTEEVTFLGTLTSQDLNEGQIGLYGFLVDWILHMSIHSIWQSWYFHARKRHLFKNVTWV